MTGSRAIVAVALIGCAARPPAAPPAASPRAPGGTPVAIPTPSPDAARRIVGRLDLERYKATIKGLTKFGDRRQGTDRNRRALDWIQAELESYGCKTERITYDFQPGPRRPGAPRAAGTSVGGGHPRGQAVKTSVNDDPQKQPDAALRELDAEASAPGERQEIFCTKVGEARPDEMYIVGAHMDGVGFGEAANDDGSGTALVMELARVLSARDVHTDRTIRFALWNNEETGLQGAAAYVAQRASRQGKEDPPGSGLYPEPRWLGMIQHDMMLFDHGMPLPSGELPPRQRPEADVDIEFQSTAKLAGEAARLAWVFAVANERYAADYPAAVSGHMTNTDSTPFMDRTPSISMRENQRGTQIGNGWDPHWHQPTDVYASFADDDFRLGLNAAQTTLGALVELAGAQLR